MTLLRPSRGEQRTSRWWRLVSLCVAANLLETTLVMSLGDGARPALAPQASALSPFGIFHDLRWISVYHDSWVGYALEVLGMLAVRSILTSVSVALAWPERVPRPDARRLLSRALISSVVCALLLTPSVALVFGLAVVPVSWLFLAGVPAALLVALVLHPVAISGDWWRRTFVPRALGWVVLAFVVLSLTSALMAASPPAVWPLLSAAAGVFNAWCWVGVVSALVDRVPSRRIVPVVPLSVIVLVAIVIGGTVLGFSRAQPPKLTETPPATAPSSGGPPVLVVSGYGSAWNGGDRHPVPGRFGEETFSYRGLDASGRPLAYRSADTVKKLSVLDGMLIDQVEALSRRTGQRVSVVAESEGSLVAKTAVLEDPSAPVATLVMASPLLAPARVAYPASTTSGWGIASDTEMRLLSRAFRSSAPIDLSPDSAFVYSVDRAGPVLEEAMSCPLPRTRQFALLPVADATVTPYPVELSYPSLVVSSFHGGLLESASSERIVEKVLERAVPAQDRFLRFSYSAISAAASAWQVPAPNSSHYSCGDAARTLSAALS